MDSQNLEPNTILLIYSIGPLAFVVLALGLRLLNERRVMRKMIKRGEPPPGTPAKIKGIFEVLKVLEPKIWRLKSRIFLITTALSLAAVFYQAWFRQREVTIDEQVFLLLIISAPYELTARLVRYKALRSYLTRAQHLVAKIGFPLVILAIALGGYALLAYHPITRTFISDELKTQNRPGFNCFTKRVGQGFIPSPGELKCQYPEYGLEFTVPSKNSYARANEAQKSLRRIRMQNYTTTEPLYQMKPGEYFLELVIYDHTKNQLLREPCTQIFTDETGVSYSRTARAGDVEVVRGTLPAGGEAPPREAICYQGKDADILISVGERRGSEDASITKAILDSVHFKTRQITQTER